MSTFNINGNTFSGNNISIVNNRVFIDGKEVGAENSDPRTLNIVINGDIETLSVDACNEIKVIGNIKKDCKTVSGNIDCNSIGGDAKSTSGNINCNGDIKGDAKTTSGNINRTL